MRKALLLLVVILTHGTSANCFAEKEALPAEKAKAERFRMRLEQMLKLPAKIKLSASQTLAYHRYREIVEPKLTDIFTRENDPLQEERSRAKRELAAAKEQIKADLNVILTGFQPQPQRPQPPQPQRQPPQPQGAVRRCGRNRSAPGYLGCHAQRKQLRPRTSRRSDEAGQAVVGIGQRIGQAGECLAGKRLNRVEEHLDHGWGDPEDARTRSEEPGPVSSTSVASRSSRWIKT